MSSSVVVGRPTFTRRQASNTMITMQGSTLRVAAYIRVSTDMQAQFGLSLEAQESMLRKYAALNDYTISETYIDTQSAKDTHRPSYERMMHQVYAGKIDLIICTKLDRFSRSSRDFYAFIEDYVNAGIVNLALINERVDTSQPATRMMLPLMIACAQMERERTAERVKTSIAYIRGEGGHYGKIPYGYMTEGEGKIKKLIPNPMEQSHIADMAQMYKAGKKFSEIADQLNASNVKPRQISKWTENAVYLLLIREGIHRVRSVQSDATYDREQAYQIAYRLRADERTYSHIADQLNKAGLRPQKAARYEWYSVQELLRGVAYYDRSTPKGYAQYLQAQGKSLRTIATELLKAGHTPKRGGQWYPQTVKQLLLT